MNACRNSFMLARCGGGGRAGVQRYAAPQNGLFSVAFFRLSCYRLDMATRGMLCYHRPAYLCMAYSQGVCALYGFLISLFY